MHVDVDAWIAGAPVLMTVAQFPHADAIIRRALLQKHAPSILLHIYRDCRWSGPYRHAYNHQKQLFGAGGVQGHGCHGAGEGCLEDRYTASGCRSHSAAYLRCVLALFPPHSFHKVFTKFSRSFHEVFTAVFTEVSTEVFTYRHLNESEGAVSACSIPAPSIHSVGNNR